MLIRLAGGKTTFSTTAKRLGQGFAGYVRRQRRKARGRYFGHRYKSVAVPGTVAGLELALKSYGTMKLADVMAPAIRLAEEGFPVSGKLAKGIGRGKSGTGAFPVSRRIFLNNGHVESGRHAEAARTCRHIETHGQEWLGGFYQGETAKILVEEMARNGGLITLDDLAHYKVKVREVLQAKYDVDGHAWKF